MGRRNVQGGNKTKGMARFSGNRQERALRVVESEEEEYAIVTAVSGNGRFRIISENKKKYIALLPGSMRGNKKRSNYVELNTIILINNRLSWQTEKEMSQADIVHVYSPNHIQELKLYEKFEEQLSYNGRSKDDNNIIQFTEEEQMIQEEEPNSGEEMKKCTQSEEIDLEVI